MGKWSAFLLSIGMISLPAWAVVRPDTIYQADDRRDWYQVTDPQLLDWAAATAVMIPKTDLSLKSSSWFDIQAQTYGKYKNLCVDQPFREQPVPGDCSAFLVGRDLMVTAGHCIESAADCRKYAIVFDYAIPRRGEVPYQVHTAQVFYCQDIVARANSGDYDYAVFHLNRDVIDRQPLRIRRTGAARVGDRLTLIGHPMGLPSKIADDGRILSLVPLKASVDAFSGNSGSAVINRASGEVEGILVDGGTDYERVGSCNKEYRCRGRCGGETLFPISQIRRFVPEI